MPTSTVPLAELASLVDGLFGIGLAECHGALTGALCRVTPPAVHVAALFPAAGAQPTTQQQAALDAWRDVTHAQLVSQEGDFQLPFPDDETALAERAQSLGEWCEGFLYGFSQAGKLDLKQLSDEAQEIIEDLTQFTRASFDEGSDLELEENAYAELVEYVRVGVQLLFVELSPRPAAVRSH